MSSYTFSGPGRVKVFKRVGRCIYCGTDERNLTREQGNLTEEHIIPFGLGGNMILPASSCAVCQAIINEQFEQPLQRGMAGMFTPARASIGLHGRKRGKNKAPLSITLTIQGLLGINREIKLTGRDIPFALAGFLSGPPEYFLGHPSRTLKTWIYSDHQHLLRLGVKPGERVHGLGHFDSLQHSRLIAKIALALTYATFPYKRVRPWVRDLILGKDEFPFRLVGSQINPGRTNNLHKLSVGRVPEMPFPMPPGSDKIIGASVTLFHSYGAPEYLVLVGELDGSFEDRFPI